MWTVVESPVGDLRVVARDGADGAVVTSIEFAPWRRDGRPLGDPRGDRDDDHPVLVAVRDQLSEYFARDRREFDLPLLPGGSDFQRQVWRQLELIPWGETASYGEVARRMGMTNSASRAVGLANGRNPIPIVIPCHRVIGADGSLTGYGGGVERKQVLLALEQNALF